MLALVACGGAGSGTTTLTGQCISIAPPHMLYPQSAATAIPDGNFDLYVSYWVNPTPPWVGPILTPASGTAVGGSSFTAASGPAPNGATPPPGDQVFVSHVPALAAGTMYSVSLLAAGMCGGAGLGSFTTQ
jgi:hypothetical protein